MSSTADLSFIAKRKIVYVCKYLSLGEVVILILSISIMLRLRLKK
jgi:hypothetical protein